MTLNCTNIKLKKGSNNSNVKELQTLLKKYGFYTGKIDGSFGSITESSVKSFQKKYNLTVDGWVGSETCKKLNSLNNNTSSTTKTNNTNTNNENKTSNTSTYSYYKNGIYHSGQHWISSGCNKKGQCTSYYCACCCMKQQLAKQNIDNYTQQKLATYAGTTSKGTSHEGIATALYKVSKETCKKISIKWYNFKDMGKTDTERFEAVGKELIKQNTGIIWHTLYKYQFGHYETIQEINMNNKTVTVLNSLGDKCNSPAYCGYTEIRKWDRFTKELAGRNPNIGIITFE